MYAIVRAGGRQEKVSVGDVLIIDKVNGEAGDSIDLTPLLLVDGSTVTSDAGKLAKVKVTAEVVRSFHEAGASTLLVTDDLMAPASSQATHVLVCAPAAAGEFDTAAPGIVLVEAVAAAIASRVRGRRGRRLDLAEQLWKQFGTY